MAIKNSASVLSLSIERIEPNEAMLILSHPGNKNRTIKKVPLDTFVALMQRGNFGLSPDPIVLGPTGILYNGQHRLTAVVISGIGQVFVVARYLTDEDARGAILIIDRGSKRTLGNVGEMNGVLPDRGDDRVAVATCIYTIETGNCRTAPPDTVLRLCLHHAEDYEAARSSLTKRSANAAQTAAFVWARRANPDYIDRLTRKVATAEGLSPGEALLRRALEEPTSTAGGYGRLQSSLKLLRGIESLLDGKELKVYIRNCSVQERAEIVARYQARFALNAR